MTESKKFVPFVSADSTMKEFTFRAVMLGVLMAVIMSAANAYLGLKAGMTIAATYTAAVLSMAILKPFNGSILEENTARTIGSIGGNIAAGAIFTLPAFYIASIWDPFFSITNYFIATIILIIAGVLGIMFVAMIRRVMVEDAELPFPESIAAAEIHKSAQTNTGGSKFLLTGMGLGVLFSSLVEFKFIADSWQKVVTFAKGGILLKSPFMSPAYLGVGYIIGPNLAGVNFSGGLLAWGLMAPMAAYFLNYNNPEVIGDWGMEINRVWKDYIRYIAIGGMLVGAFYTLYKMRNSLFAGISRAFKDVTKATGEQANTPRTEKDINIKWVSIVIGLIAVIMFFIYNYFANDIFAAIVATVVMLLLGFVFAAISGYLVGIIGVSSNPTSGLTVSILVIVAFLMVALGMKGNAGIAAVLGVAAVACASVSVAGEMLQDLKAGHILGCTPWRMQLGNIFGVTSSALAMFLVLSLLHIGDIKQASNDKIQKLKSSNISEIEYNGKKEQFMGKTYSITEIQSMAPEMQNEVMQLNAGFGGEKIPAPQASLMAIVAKSIVEGKTEWILIIVGMLMGISFILMQVKSPMLISVGMYLPIGTSFAIYVGGLIKGLLDYISEKQNNNAKQKEKMSNTGTLLASGLIAGEALLGLLFAGLAFAEIEFFRFSESPSFLLSLLSMAFIGFVIIRSVLKNKD